MKRTLALALAMLVVAAPVLAETVSAPTITATAVVSNAMTITVDLRRDIAGFPDLTNNTAMNFGTLIGNPSNGGATLIAAEGIVAFVTTNTHSVPYTVSQTVSATLTSGLNTIPAGAFVVIPVYAAADNGGVTEGTIGTQGTAVATGKLLYTSGGVHGMRTIQAHYTITDDPALGATSFVPAAQQGGTYTTTVVISATR